MNGRGGVVRFFLFLFLLVIVLLQIFSMVQSDRFYRALNQLDEILKGGGSMRGETNEPNVIGEGDEEYPGDEGDWLVWGFRVEPRTLNPISTDQYAIWITIPYIFEPLLAYDYDESRLKPFLAESSNVSDDGLQITFRLREDIHFSDGVPVTTDDVIFTYETIVNPQVDAANIANSYAEVEKVVKVDERVVKFFMKKPYFKSLENLSFTWSMGILPKHIYEFIDASEFNKHRSNPIGSGPYVFEKWDVGREIVLHRNEKYWGPEPKLKKIVWRFISNPVACVQALRSHEVDIMIPEPEQFAGLVKDEQFKKEFYCLSYWTPWTPFYYIGWNHNTKFFGDRRVRLAMTHAINREQIVSRLLEGYGQTITGPFYIHGPQNDPNIEAWPYDLEKARKLLDEAGWVDTDGDGLRDKGGVPFRFEFMYSTSYVLYERLAKLLKDDLLKIGVELVPGPCEWSILMGRLNDRDYEAVVAGWGGDMLDDPYQMFHSSQIANKGSNYVGFNNAHADALIEEARRTIEDAKRNKLYHQLHRLLHEEQPYTFLFTRPTFRFLDRRFENVKIHKLGLKYWEWYVPKAEQRYR